MTLINSCFRETDGIWAGLIVGYALFGISGEVCPN